MIRRGWLLVTIDQMFTEMDLYGFEDFDDDGVSGTEDYDYDNDDEPYSEDYDDDNDGEPVSGTGSPADDGSPRD